MRLRFLGMICPDCGEPASYMSALAARATWIGYTRMVWCNCDSTRRFEQRSWILLFDERRKFIGVVSGDEWFLINAGDRMRDVDEIPF
jgi:hypothetical protein